MNSVAQRRARLRAVEQRRQARSRRLFVVYDDSERGGAVVTMNGAPTTEHPGVGDVVLCVTYAQALMQNPNPPPPDAYRVPSSQDIPAPVTANAAGVGADWRNTRIGRAYAKR